MTPRLTRSPVRETYVKSYATITYSLYGDDQTKLYVSCTVFASNNDNAIYQRPFRNGINEIDLPSGGRPRTVLATHLSPKLFTIAIKAHHTNECSHYIKTYTGTSWESLKNEYRRRNRLILQLDDSPNRANFRGKWPRSWVDLNFILVWWMCNVMCMWVCRLCLI